MSGADGGKVVVITGAAGGLGRAMAEIFLARGWTVAALDRDAAALEAHAGRGRRGHDPYPVDVTRADVVDAVVNSVIATHGRIDIVINNAGITQLGPFAEMSGSVLRKVMDVNFFGAVNVTRATLPALRQSRGSLVAMSSVAGFAPLVRRTAYAASKHAMEGFFGSLRAEERENGVHVLIACPSFVNTNQGAGMLPDGTHRPGAADDTVGAMGADEAARVIVAAIDGRRDFVAVGRVAQVSWWIRRLSPRLYEHLMLRSIRKR